MALKSSQPRRNASVKSEKPILRTTNRVATPNNCSLGLAKYVVAMAPVSLLVVAGGKRRASTRANSPHARKSRLSPANQIQREGALPDDTCRDRYASLARWMEEARKRSRLGELCTAQIC